MVKKLLWIVLAVAITLAALYGVAFWQGSYRDTLEQVEAPLGSQLLTYPMSSGIIVAGYQNQAYFDKFNYAHYGLDITTLSPGYADILASGEGMVLGTEFCSNSLGNIAVIQYDNAYLPGKGEVANVVARYYHMDAVSIQKGDMVYQGQVIGRIDRSHQWYNHIHLELDLDTSLPFNTPQVAEASSSLLNRYPADGKMMEDPVTILAAGKGQRIDPYPNSPCCTEKDIFQYKE